VVATNWNVGWLFCSARVVATNWKVYLRIRGFLANGQSGWGIWVLGLGLCGCHQLESLFARSCFFWPTGNLVGVFGF
jgi:hypothetical protein